MDSFATLGGTTRRFDLPLSESEILKRMNRIQHIPATLIHGRRDISSPAATAWKLHRLWPNSTLIIDEGDGHGGASMVEHWTAANARLSTES